MSSCNDVTKSTDSYPDAENLSRSSTSRNTSSREVLQSFVRNASERRSQLSPWENVLRRQSPRSLQINPDGSPLPSPRNPDRPIEQVFNALKSAVSNLGEQLRHIDRTGESHYAEENRNNVIDYLKERDERTALYRQSVDRKFGEISAAVENLTEMVRDQRSTINELNQQTYRPNNQFLLPLVLFSVACFLVFKKVSVN